MLSQILCVPGTLSFSVSPEGLFSHVISFAWKTFSSSSFSSLPMGIFQFSFEIYLLADTDMVLSVLETTLREELEIGVQPWLNLERGSQKGDAGQGTERLFE